MGVLICWVPPSWALRISRRHIYTFSTKWIKSLLCKIISMTWRTLRLSSISCGHAWDCAKSCSCSALSLLDLPPEAFKRFDAGLRRSLERITNSSLDDLAWQQASLHINMGGLGLRQASASALPAFVGSRSSTRELALHLLGADPDDPVESDYIPSGEESQAREQLRLILPDLLHPASQRSIQRALDSLSFTSLEASLCLRDQARLNTIASPHAGAWL